MLLRKAITKGCAPNSVLSAVRSHRSARLIWTAASQSCHIAGSTGAPSVHFKPATMKSISFVGLAKPQRNRFEKDSHRVLALNRGDGVGRVHFGHIFGHARPHKRALQATAY